jgi:hypothetical protein
MKKGPPGKGGPEISDVNNDAITDICIFPAAPASSKSITRSRYFPEWAFSAIARSKTRHRITLPRLRFLEGGNE